MRLISSISIIIFFFLNVAKNQSSKNTQLLYDTFACDTNWRYYELSKKWYQQIFLFKFVKRFVNEDAYKRGSKEEEEADPGDIQWPPHHECESLVGEA